MKSSETNTQSSNRRLITTVIGLAVTVAGVLLLAAALLATPTATLLAVVASLLVVTGLAAMASPDATSLIIDMILGWF